MPINKNKISKMQSLLLLSLTLMVAAFWVNSAVAAEKNGQRPHHWPDCDRARVWRDSKCLAPSSDWWADQWDVYYASVRHSAGVLENLGMRNWGIDRDEFDFQGVTPVSALIGMLAESWDISPDGLTYTFNIRKGVYWHNKPPMNGRELTADDIEYNFHRLLGLGSGFTEPTPFGAAAPLVSMPFESITATDDWTVVIKLKEPHLAALSEILFGRLGLTYAPRGNRGTWRRSGLEEPGRHRALC